MPSLNKQYLFIGGPWDMQTRPCDGRYLVECMGMATPVLNAALTAAEISNSEVSFGTVEVHRYLLNNVSVFGTVRRVYVHDQLPLDNASQRLGILLAHLLDIYVDC